MEVGGIDPGRLVFVDEMGTHISLAHVYAYAPVGERAFFEIPRNRGKNTTLLTARTPRSLRASIEKGWADGPFYGRGRGDQRPGVRSLRRTLAGPCPAPRTARGDGQPRSTPAKEGVRELIEWRDCELIYLPSYSPNFNPIEQALSKIKHLLRKIGARTKEALIEAMGRALAAVSAQDVRGFFVHCGYPTPAQQL
jgi:hypothetical protein